MTRLSTHFSLKELTRSQTAERKGIKNHPNDREIENLKLVCENILEPVREHYGIPFTPSSGFRSFELNKAIGSSSKSQHITGKAVDFEIPGVPNMEVALWIKEHLDYDQLLLEFYKEKIPDSGWVHCSYVGQENRKESKRFDGRKWSPLS
jgi:zinc D-Ala-D-Ala carboxypeptidase|tara:strand:- start:539 stop:988 length:450 start_codon:yes stop_codon:yes gene_type:complete